MAALYIFQWVVSWNFGRFVSEICEKIIKMGIFVVKSQFNLQKTLVFEYKVVRLGCIVKINKLDLDVLYNSDFKVKVTTGLMTFDLFLL